MRFCLGAHQDVIGEAIGDDDLIFGEAVGVGQAKQRGRSSYTEGAAFPTITKMEVRHIQKSQVIQYGLSED